jgi:glucose/mannose-6-phosphate isomerase
VSELTRAAIADIDPQSMLDDVLAQPGQIDDALWRVESAAVPGERMAGGLLVCGMGGSAIGGDLARACIGERATAPIRVTRAYAPEPWLGDKTLVLCVSYSGETEETLASYEAARAAGAPRVALTTGGRLAAAARADGVPVIGVPAGMQPRAAVVYMTVAALECAAASGAGPSLHRELQDASAELAEFARAWAPDGPECGVPGQLARAMDGVVPIVYGVGLTAAVARRWKTQLNENAKVPAFFSELPEADHNEICGYSVQPAAPVQAIFLEEPEQDPRLTRRVEATAEVAAGGVTGGRAATQRLAARGRSATARVLSLVLLGDLVSVYLAALRGVDPTPVAAIERLKRLLAE